jgi:hypothetical protein
MPSEAAKVYLSHAVMCEDCALMASEEASRKTFREAARLWVHIAEHAEYLSQRAPMIRAVGRGNHDPD